MERTAVGYREVDGKPGTYIRIDYSLGDESKYISLKVDAAFGRCGDSIEDTVHSTNFHAWEDLDFIQKHITESIEMILYKLNGPQSNKDRFLAACKKFNLKDENAKHN